MNKFVYKDIKEVVSIAYKKLKASIYFDKTQSFLRHRIAIEEEIEDGDGKYEKHVLRVAEAIEDLIKGKEIKWNKLREEIMGGISVIAFPKKNSEQSSDKKQTIIFNKKSKNNKIKITEWQYFVNLSIEGHILGVIWTMFIGMALDSNSQMYEHVYANRLLKDVEYKNSPKLFEPYFTQYESWREHALSDAKRCIESSQDALIITMDLKRYFYSVDIEEPEFKNMFEVFQEYFNENNFKIKDLMNSDVVKLFEKINEIVNEIFINYSRKLKEHGDENFKDINTILPIGFMPSMIISNWKLKDFDKAIITRINPVYYGRYVDDIILVDKVEKNSEIYNLAEKGELDQNEILNYYFIKCIANKKTKCEQECSILTVKDDGYLIKSNLLGGKSNVKLQDSKVKVFYFKEKSTSSLIDCFKKQIAQSASAFLLMPNVDCLAFDHDYGEFFKLVNSESVNKFRGIEKFEFDKYGASKALGKLLKVTNIISDKNEVQIIKDILDIFDARLYIENYTLWERLFEILIVNKQIEILNATINNIKEILDKQIESTDNLDKINIKNLYQYLLISVYRPVSLLGLEDINKVIKNLESIFIDKSIYLNHILAYRRTRLLSKYIMPIYIDFIEDDIKNPKCLCDFREVVKSLNSVEKMSSLETFYKYLPFTVTPQDISFALKCCELENYNEGKPLSKQGFGENVFKLYRIINNFEISDNKNFVKYFIPYSMKGDKQSKDIDNVFIDITDNSQEKCGVEKLKIAIGNAKIDLLHIEQILKGNLSTTYYKYQQVINLINLAIKEKVDMLVLPECYLPFEWIPLVTNMCTKNDIALITGMEYYLSNKTQGIERNVYNLTAIILPYKWKDHKFANITFHHKCHYSPFEIEEIEGFNQVVVKGSGYELYRWKGVYFPVYCCYELASIKDRSLFANQLDVLVAVEWNKDINYFSNIIESLARDLHCYCIQVNSSDYGDSRIVQPARTEIQNIIKTKGGINATVLIGEVEIANLREFQQKSNMLQKSDARFKQTPPGFDHNSPYRKIEGNVIDGNVIDENEIDENNQKKKR